MKNIDDRIIKFWTNKYKLFGLITLFLVGGILFFIITQELDNNDYERFIQEYDFIESCDSLSGIVKEITCNKGASRVSLSNGSKLIFPTSRNYDYEIFLLCCFINIGDSIQKKKDCDTLHVFRKKQEYYFILGEFIGEKYNSRFYNNPCK